MPRDLNDALDNLFNGLTGTVRSEPVRDVPDYVSPAQRFEEGCPKCGGTGRFRTYSGRDGGECFACKGRGKRSFATSAEDRAKSREQAAARKAANGHISWAAFEAINPTVAAWLKAETAKPQPFEFATAMVEAIVRWGDLTQKQLETCERLAAKAGERASSRAARAADAPAVSVEGVDRLKAAFDTAIAYSAEKGLKLSPRLTFSGVTISPAKATSANPGALYVKQRGGEYLGKIVGGVFKATDACDAQTAAKVVAFVNDPEQAAKVHGQTTGECCVCGATLISKWKHAGIGPICAQKFGW